MVQVQKQFFDHNFPFRAIRHMNTIHGWMEVERTSHLSTNNRGVLFQLTELLLKNCNLFIYIKWRCSFVFIDKNLAATWYVDILFLFASERFKENLITEWFILINNFHWEKSVFQSKTSLFSTIKYTYNILFERSF